MTDDRIGAALDKIFAKIETLDSQLTVNLLNEFDVDMSEVHFDPSSYEVKGEPCARAGDPKSIEAKKGRNGKGEFPATGTVWSFNNGERQCGIGRKSL